MYISIVMAFFFFIIALPTFLITYKAPSCTDHKQNQDEQGVDCGGPCSILCKASATDLLVHWQRAFKVKDGVYNVLAYVENSNLDSGIESISYHFKLYDSENILIAERTGKTFVPAKKIFGIFEGNILTGTRIPTKATFEFTQTPWIKESPNDLSVAISQQVLSADQDNPRLTATFDNLGINPLYNIEVVAIVYDEDDNAVAASRTIVDQAVKGQSVPLIFTWPTRFANNAVRSEILYRVLR